MIEHGMTIRQAAERWVHEMNAFPHGMIEKLAEDFDEVTTPARHDRVYVFCDRKGTGDGEIVNVIDDNGTPVYEIELDSGETIIAHDSEFSVEYDSILPAWGTMWSFGDPCDDYWLEEMGGVELMSRCGFRVYESNEFGYIFGIDAGGFDFYEAFWIPLYKARGLKWHDPMTESGSYVMTESRRSDLYRGLLDHISEMISDQSELVSALKKIGFSDQEIALEGMEVRKE